MLARSLLSLQSSSSRRTCLFFVRNVSNSSVQQQVAKQTSQQQLLQRQRRGWERTVLIVVSTSTAVALFAIVSIQIRQERAKQIQSLPLAETVWNQAMILRPRSVTPTQLIATIQRAGLMGTQHSVMQELHDIRKWHHEHDFKGGLVLRDLNQPLYHDVQDDGDSENQNVDDETDGDNHNNETLSVAEIIQDPARLARRECYYVYYEVKGNGAVEQQIFCRGTTLWIDIVTCFQAWMVYDPILGCRVHKGFRDQAERILQDVLPLLAPPSDPRATIELCGHSLGGAVAAILSVKLAKMGYKVVRLTTIGEPRYCNSTQDADILLQQLPKDHLRVENDLDFVSFLPPFGAHVGRKLWLTNDGTVRYVSTEAQHQHPWTDSVWVNFLAWEILTSNGIPHRIPTYVERLVTAFKGGTRPRQ